MFLAEFERFFKFKSLLFIEELAGVTRKKEMHHDKAKEFYAEAKAAKEEAERLHAQAQALVARRAGALHRADRRDAAQGRGRRWWRSSRPAAWRRP